MKALVGAFNQEKALVGAFSVIVQLHRWIDLRHYPAASPAQTLASPPCICLHALNMLNTHTSTDHTLHNICLYSSKWMDGTIAKVEQEASRVWKQIWENKWSISSNESWKNNWQLVVGSWDKNFAPHFFSCEYLNKCEGNIVRKLRKPEKMWVLFIFHLCCSQTCKKLFCLLCV